MIKQLESFFSSAQVQIFLLSLVVFTLPLKENYNSLSIILLVTFMIGHFYFNKEKLKLNLKKGKPLILFYGYALFAMIYTENFSEGLNQLQKLLPFVIFAVIFSITELNEKNKNSIFWSFCISCLIISIFLFTTNMYTHFYNPNNINIWYYSGYTKSIDLHPAYYILFLVFNIFFLFEEFSKPNTKIKKTFISFVIIVFTFQILFLQSRVGLISFFITLFVFFFFTQKSKKKHFLIMFAFIIIFFITASQFNFLNRFVEIPESIKERITLWHGWWNSYKDNPFLGYGTGDGQSALDYGNYMLGNNFFVFYKYNTHNQYLDVLLRYGLIGFTSFVFIFYSFFINMRKNPNRLMLIFVILICFFFLTENILQRQKGIVFFSFFYMLLNNSNNNEN